MSALFNETMTVYNYSRDEDGTEQWRRTVVRGIQWRHRKNDVTVRDQVATETRVESVTIDFQRLYGNKPYIEPDKYKRLDSAQKEAYWTLDDKSEKDVIVYGEKTETISEEYRLSSLIKDNQYAVTVQAVSDNRNRRGLKHIKVVGS